MKHEKIIKREDGTKYQITVSFWLNNNIPNYDTSLQRCEPGKRKFCNPLDEDSYTYRGLSMEDRKKSRNSQMLSFVTPEEIQTAKIELWTMLKPTE